MSRIVRSTALVALVGLTGALLVACSPRFPPDSSLTARPMGRLVKLRWTAATADADKRIVSYRIEVNGRPVARVPGSMTSCVLSGLAGGARYRLAVVAKDNTGASSRGWKTASPASAAVSTKVTVPAVGAPAGPVYACVPPADLDRDRLPDAFETGTGTFVGVHATGTDANDHDSDDDGLSDGDEVLGTRQRLDLYRVGARPTKQELLVEFDWFDDSQDCGAHSHRPSAQLVERMRTDLAAVGVPNPDGSTGINLISDIGQGGGLTGGNLVPDADGDIVGGVSGTDFDSIKAANFRPERQGYFHYALQVHRLNPGAPETGQAWVGGVDSVDALWICALPVVSASSIILHELGHNLGLDHGGADGFINFKPNYNSVMNYRYLFTGTDTDCDGAGDGGPVFSTGKNAPLDENALLEPVGICNGVPIDWNFDGRIQPEPLKLDLTPISFGQPLDGRYDILTDYNDVANLCLNCIERFQPGALVAAQQHRVAPHVVTDAPPVPILP